MRAWRGPLGISAGILSRVLFMRLLCMLLMLFSVNASAADVLDLVRQGESKLQAGEIDAAVAVLESAVAMDAASPIAHTRLGGALLLKQEQTAAIEHFRKAIALDAENAHAFVGIAIAEIHLGRYQRARAALMEAKAIDPDKGDEVDSLIDWLDSRTGAERVGPSGDDPRSPS